MTIHAHPTLLRAAGRRLALACAAILSLVGSACDEALVDDERAVVGREAEFDLAEPVRPRSNDDADKDPDGCDDGTFDDATSCGDDAEREPSITSCYCGLYQNSPLYVGVECAGYPSAAVCCAEKCSILIGALNGQL